MGACDPCLPGDLRHNGRSVTNHHLLQNPSLKLRPNQGLRGYALPNAQLSLGVEDCHPRARSRTTRGSVELCRFDRHRVLGHQPRPYRPCELAKRDVSPIRQFWMTEAQLRVCRIGDPRAQSRQTPGVGRVRRNLQCLGIYQDKAVATKGGVDRTRLEEGAGLCCFSE